ncbi:T9SS type A sorting domain-containing protein [candidate division WOR-3 bacterium]|nr:T9SS type A sorting domain-containing protein [candidate division WOR-3 bacterium]
MKKSVMFVALMLMAFGLFADVAITGDCWQPYKASVINNVDVTTPVQVNAQGYWRGIAQPGRNLTCKNDTISVVYSVLTTTPTYNQKMYQSYSTDNGATWSLNAIGHNDCLRTYPHADQIFDVTNMSDPFGASPYVIWAERLSSAANDTLFFAYDDYPTFGLFNPVPVNVGITPYFPVVCVFGTGDSLIAMATDNATDDLIEWVSYDGGVTWTQVTFRPIGTDQGSVSTMIDNGKGGYAVAFYSIQEATGENFPPRYKETNDYGQTWSAEQLLFDVEVGGYTFSMSWQGYSVVMDPINNYPYFLVKLDTGITTNESYTYGEIWFQKPNGGTPGAYTFGDAVPVIVDDPSVFNHIASAPTIAFYRSAVDSSVILLGTVSAFVDEVIGTDTFTQLQLIVVTSQDEGNTWDEYQITSYDAGGLDKSYPSGASYIDSDGDYNIFFTDSTQGDNVVSPVYHISCNVVTDLGLPAVGPYVVGVEETPINEIPNMYNVTTTTQRGQCSFTIGLPEGGMTSLRIFDVSGRIVTDVVNRYLSAGQYKFDWNTGTVPSGNYVFRLTSNGFITTGKVLITQ